MATTLTGTESHSHARALLGAALGPAGRPSHAYLFHGPAGVGKRAAARAFAAELLAEGAADPERVRRRVTTDAHPDLTWVVPSGAHGMRVDDVAGPVIAAATLTPFEARRRAFVLERVETLGDEAANRLLKTLEEPGDHVHLILLSDRLCEVLPTVVSRCQLVRFDPLSAAGLEAALERGGVAPGLARACARLALGNGERAHALASDEGVELRSEAECFARAALTGELAQRPWLTLLARAKQAGERAREEVEATLAEQLVSAAKKDRKALGNDFGERAKRVERRARTATLDLALELAGLWYRDLACTADGALELVFASDRAEQLAADADGRESAALREALELVEDTRRRLKRNVGEELACEALAYRLELLLRGAR